MKIIIDPDHEKVEEIIKKIKETLMDYFTEHISKLEEKYKTRLNVNCVIRLEKEEIQKLQEFGFDYLLKKLNRNGYAYLKIFYKTFKGFVDSKGFYITVSEKTERISDDPIDLLYQIAKTFVLKKGNSKYMDEVCEFWCDLIHKFFEKEKEHLDFVWNEFIQTKVFKEVSVLKKF